MRKITIAASAAAMLAALTMAALAAEAKGTIQSIDPAAGTVTLSDGNTYTLPQDFDAASLQVGQDVTVTYEPAADGAMVATAVTTST